MVPCSNSPTKKHNNENSRSIKFCSDWVMFLIQFDEMRDSDKCLCSQNRKPPCDLSHARLSFQPCHLTQEFDLKSWGDTEDELPGPSGKRKLMDEDLREAWMHFTEPLILKDLLSQCKGALGNNGAVEYFFIPATNMDFFLKLFPKS